MLDQSDDIHPLFHGAPSTTEFKKLRKRIVRNVREAIEQYGMIERNARWHPWGGMGVDDVPPRGCFEGGRDAS